MSYFKEQHLQHMGVPRPEVQLELQLPAYAKATETLDLSCICDLHRNLLQCQILNPLSEARDRTRNLMVPRWIHLPLSHNGNSQTCIFLTDFSKESHVSTFFKK